MRVLESLIVFFFHFFSCKIMLRNPGGIDSLSWQENSIVFFLIHSEHFRINKFMSKQKLNWRNINIWLMSLCLGWQNVFYTSCEESFRVVYVKIQKFPLEKKRMYISVKAGYIWLSFILLDCIISFIPVIWVIRHSISLVWPCALLVQSAQLKWVEILLVKLRKWSNHPTLI